MVACGSFQPSALHNLDKSGYVHIRSPAERQAFWASPIGCDRGKISDQESPQARDHFLLFRKGPAALVDTKTLTFLPLDKIFFLSSTVQKHKKTTFLLKSTIPPFLRDTMGHFYGIHFDMSHQQSQTDLQSKCCWGRGAGLSERSIYIYHTF